MNIFVSYAHADSAWLDRLLVHLKQMVYDLEIDAWSDRRLRGGNQWKSAIDSALQKADVAILLISADFLASGFIREHELSPLLAKAKAEKDGVIILPLIVGPSLFSKTPELSVYQAVNDPKNPLICVQKGEQERVFASMADLIFDQASAKLRAVGISQPRAENFLDSAQWANLVKLGEWQLDSDGIKGHGVGSFLLSRYEYGDRGFEINAEIIFSEFEKPDKNQYIGMNAGMIFGWLSGYFNLLLTGSGVLLERIGRPENGVKLGHLSSLIKLDIDVGLPVNFKVKVSSGTVSLIINGAPILELKDVARVVGRVGVRAWRSRVLIKSFEIQELTEQ